jgi:hypothetical protein
MASPSFRDPNDGTGAGQIASCFGSAAVEKLRPPPPQGSIPQERASSAEQSSPAVAVKGAPGAQELPGSGIGSPSCPAGTPSFTLLTNVAGVSTPPKL